MKVKALVPWWGKITAKIILSRIPTDYRLWQRFDLFKHGEMERPEYAYNVFQRHFERFDKNCRSQRCILLEVGPGDSLASAMLASAYGSGAVYLIDTGSFARKDVGPYVQMMAFMKDKGLKTPDWSGAESLQDLLKTCNARYGTEGLNSLKQIPSESVDFIFSHAVLEHIRKSQFVETMRELRRIIKSDGMCSHCVDLKDHMGGGLNNLRFSESLWESEFMARSGFYTNRIRYDEMLNIFFEAGFSSEIINVDSWDRLPIQRRALAKEFLSFADEELLISDFDVILRPRN